MKIAFTFLAVLILSPAPDEGQWLPIQIRNMDWKKLEAKGMKMTKDEFWHPTKGGVLSAAVHLGGCTASFVSDVGLVVTNHHCGFGAIQRLSTVEKNYVRDGFVANSRKEELRTNMTVAVVRKIEDVTELVHAAQAKAKSPAERVRATRTVTQSLVAKGQQEPNTRCMVASFFEGRQYHLYYRTVLTDVRLVYAPPRSVGEYGGEVDNWEWPRHTGDFSFFRAYASPEGKSRRYHKDNVPFKPEHYLGVSRKGIHEGDMVLILGYPGRTERYLTSTAVADRQSIYYPLRHELFTNIIQRIEAACEGSAKMKLAFSGTVKSLANVQKNALGMIKGLARNATVQLKMEQEELFTDWVQQDEARRKKYGTLLTDLKTLDEAANKNTLRNLTFVTLMSSRAGSFFRTLVDMSRAMSTQRVSKGLVEAVSNPGITRHLKTMQAPILAYLIDEVKSLPEEHQLAGFADFATGDKGTLAAVLAALKDSKLTTPEGRTEFLRGGKEALEASDDALVLLARGMVKEWTSYGARLTEQDGKRMIIGRQWIEAQQKWRGKSFYPDANSTLRVAIASVKGYEPRDGLWCPPHTTVKGILEKDTGEEPFNVPEALKKAAKNRQSSAFFDKKIGDVPVCFLADGDTTGGNSGSPVINGSGELVGLNFDRAFESVSGDYGWNKQRSRNISVDIRFVLWFLEQVVPARHLLEEMTEATDRLKKKRR